MILLRLINKSSCPCISERQRGCKAEPVVHSLSLSRFLRAQKDKGGSGEGRELNCLGRRLSTYGPSPTQGVTGAWVKKGLPLGTVSLLQLSI